MGKKLNKEYIYNVGDIVNEELKIIKQTRNKNGARSYEVQSLIHPNAPNYNIIEGDLKKGCKCRYTHGRKTIYEGNSLWSVKELRKYIINIEEAKTIPPYYKKKIRTKCPNCKREKESYPGDMMRRPYSCEVCDRGYSYAELFFISYAEVKGLYFEKQKRFDGLKNRRFDFYNKDIGVVETHGKQHYKKDKSSNWDYEKTINSDSEKKKYCLNNDIRYIEIDCFSSDFSYIKNSIDKCEYLPNIEENDIDKILKIMVKNKQYPIKEIVQMYSDGFSTIKIADKYRVSPHAIERLLKRNNIKLRGARTVRCINNGMVFKQQTLAAKWCGLKDKGVNIGKVCKGERQSSGKDPITKEPLLWEYVEEDN